MDEADLLADSLAILGIPGKLRAIGTPVSLKTTLGTGYTIHVVFDSETRESGDSEHFADSLLSLLRDVAPKATLSSDVTTKVTAFGLHTSDLGIVANTLDILERVKSSHRVSSYDICGPNLDDVFRILVDDSEQDGPEVQNTDLNDGVTLGKSPLHLQQGKPASLFSQITTIFLKRCLIFRRSWFSPILMLCVAVCGCCIPLFYMNGRVQSCTPRFESVLDTSLYLPTSPLPAQGVTPTSTDSLLESPAGIASTLGSSDAFLSIKGVSNNSTFVSAVQQQFRNISLGGISIDQSRLNSLVAWEASAPSLTGPHAVKPSKQYFMEYSPKCHWELTPAAAIDSGAIYSISRSFSYWVICTKVDGIL